MSYHKISKPAKNYHIALKLDQGPSFKAVETPVKFQSNRAILNTNLMGWSIWYVIETGPWILPFYMQLWGRALFDTQFSHHFLWHIHNEIQSVNWWIGSKAANTSSKNHLVWNENVYVSYMTLWIKKYFRNVWLRFSCLQYWTQSAFIVWVTRQSSYSWMGKFDHTQYKLSLNFWYIYIQ